MYCDDSSTEIKLTDVTQCDLETKSILKPPKVRAPLQEVDLGNEITVEFDVIRKRRVSFAGVNRIKEFNSEAKSFCICNTPAYEEKVSTSSDSSALSTSISGNLNSLTKENDVTILDDTMDLTDLSILQPCCAMDNTAMKTQKSSEGRPDIFASKNEDSAVLHSQEPQKFFDQPVLLSRNRDENEKLVYVGPEQIFDIHKVTKPLDKFSVPDPTKILLNELLEESVADFPVDNYLKSNSLFIENKLSFKSDENRHNIGESKYSLPDCKEASPEMSFTGGIPEPMNKDMFPVISGHTQMQQKPLDISQPNMFHSLPNSLGICFADADRSGAKVFQGNTSQMEFTEVLTSNKILTLERSSVHEQNKDEPATNKSLCTSQMEFTEALPPKYPHIVYHAVTKEYIDDKFSTNFTNISQMEITEALPSRNIQGVTNRMKQESLYVDTNISVSKREENQIFGTSNMEFTEALPLLKSVSKQCNTVSSDLGSENNVSIIQKDFFAAGNKNLNDSCSMENSINPHESDLMKESRSSFKKTELDVSKENNHVHFGSNMKNSLTCPKEESQEQFTAALASLKPFTNQRSLNSEVALFGICNDILPGNISPLQEKSEFNSVDIMKHNSPSDFIDVQYKSKSKQNEYIEISNIATSSCQSKPSNTVLMNEVNASQMECTKNLSCTNIIGSDNEAILEKLDNNRNVFTNKIKSIPSSNINCLENNSSFMEFTESLLLQKQVVTYSTDLLPKTHDNVKTKINNLENNEPLNNQLNESCMMDITKIDHHLNESISNHLNQNDNIDIFNVIESNVQTMCLLEDNTKVSNENQISQMEFTEALPFRNVRSAMSDNRQQNFNNGNSCVAIENGIVATNVEYYENLSFQSSHMEFTEVLPKQKLKQMSMCSKASSLRLSENVLPSSNIQQNENISPIQKDNLDDSCSVDVTEVDYPIYNDLSKNNKDNVNIECYENRKIMAPTACSNIIESKMYLKHSDSQNLNSQNYPSASNSHNKNLVEKIQDISEMEFTTAFPSRNIQDANSETIKQKQDGEKNVFINKRKSFMVLNQNNTLDTSHMEFTEALPLRNTGINHLVPTSKNQINEASQSFVPRNDMLEHGFSSTLKKENLNVFYSMDVTQMGNSVINQSLPIGREYLSQNHDTDDKSNLSHNLKFIQDAHLVQSENHFNEKSHMEFTDALPVQRHYSKEDNMMLGGFSPMNHKNVANDDFEHEKKKDFQNRNQKKEIIEKGRKSHYPDPKNGKVEWERLVKNDSFMKVHSFEFVNPYKWKYKFKWPMELILEIPEVEVYEKTKKKFINLVSQISESDPVSVFVDSRMKKNMSIILSANWLNSHCKTIKDLLFTVNFIEEEYSKLDPLYKSLKYFYREFPFDLISGRIIFVIVNLRQEYCFEVRIDITHAEVKGKNVDIINQVGQISKAKVQQLFDQLPVNDERFFIFWRKLKKVHEL